MTKPPQLTWKGRLIAFGASALLCVAAIEGGARLLEKKGDDSAMSALKLAIQPYMMFTPYTQRHPVWKNVETHSDVPSTMTYNNFGFNGDVNFALPTSPEVLKAYAKGPNDRLILITGGSVVHGVGATANDKTTAGQLQAILNDRQSQYRYRVVNLGMGSWIAYQQFVGLSLFGLPLKPDWIVVMDGHNDASVPCPHGSGVANPMNWPQLLYLTGGGQGTSLQGPLLKWAIDHTAIARIVTGLKPDKGNNELNALEFDTDDPDARFRIKLRGLTLSELDQQVDFYVAAQDNVKELFSKANILFSTQPVLAKNAISPFYRKAFDLQANDQEVAASRRQLKDDLDAYLAKNGAAKCTFSVSSGALGYFLGRSALRLEQTVPTWAADSPRRSIRYANTEMILPDAFALRVANFVDNAHMSDLGQRRIAEYFAGYILEADLKVSFDPAALAKAVHAEAVEAYWPKARRFPYAPPSGPIPAGSPATLHKVGVVVDELSPGVLRIAEVNQAGRHYVVWAGMPAVAGKPKLVTIDVWSDTVAALRFEFLDGPKYGRVQVDLASHRIMSTSGVSSARIQDLGKGWRRVSLQVPAGDASFSLTLGLLSDDDDQEYVGSGRSIATTPPVLTATD